MFVGDALPRQVYLNLLLRLLAIYFARYALFEDAEVSRPDIERMVGSKEVCAQCVVNDEPPSWGSRLRFRGSGERAFFFGWHRSLST